MNAATKAIVRAVQGILTEGETLAGARIFPDRFHPVWREELPAVLVHCLDEEVTVRDVSPRIYLRKVRLAVTSFVEASPPPPGGPPRRVSADELLDDLGQQIEDLLAFDQRLLGTAIDCVLIETHVEPVGELAERVMSAGRQIYEVSYYTDAGEGGDVRALFDLTSVALRWGPKRGTPALALDVEALPRPGP